MKEILIIALITLSGVYANADAPGYPSSLECKTGLCQDYYYKRGVKKYCDQEEEKDPKLKELNWGPYLLRAGGGCWCSCSQFRTSVANLKN